VEQAGLLPVGLVSHRLGDIGVERRERPQPFPRFLGGKADGHTAARADGAEQGVDEVGAAHGDETVSIPGREPARVPEDTGGGLSQFTRQPDDAVGLDPGFGFRPLRRTGADALLQFPEAVDIRQYMGIIKLFRNQHVQHRKVHGVIGAWADEEKGVRFGGADGGADVHDRHLAAVGPRCGDARDFRKVQGLQRVAALEHDVFRLPVVNDEASAIQPQNGCAGLIHVAGAGDAVAVDIRRTEAACEGLVEIRKRAATVREHDAFGAVLIPYGAELAGYGIERFFPADGAPLVPSAGPHAHQGRLRALGILFQRERRDAARTQCRTRGRVGIALNPDRFAVFDSDGNRAPCPAHAAYAIDCLHDAFLNGKRE